MSFVRLKLSQATKICEGVVNACSSRGFAPIIVVVLDANGDQVAYQRMDGCLSKAYPQFAHAKAFTSITIKNSSRAFRDKYTSSNDATKFCQMLSMINITGGQMAAFPGGVLLLSKEDGEVLGAVGVSGAAGDEDEYCAIAGVQEAELGISTVPEQHALKGLS